MHAVALGHAVAGSGNIELSGHAACRPYSLFDIFHKLLKGPVAGVHIRIGIGYANDRFA